jgi:hypothetical protein
VKLPPFGVNVGVATVSASVTLRVKNVVFVTPPPVAVTVMGKLPKGVEPVVLILNTVEHAGAQAAEEKDTVAPGGRPDPEKETDWALPDTKVALTERVPEDPLFTDISPELAIAKSNGRLLASRKSQPLTYP